MRWSAAGERSKKRHCMKKKTNTGKIILISLRVWHGNNLLLIFTDSCLISAKIHVYKTLRSNLWISYLSEFKPSVSNFFTPLTNCSYLKSGFQVQLGMRNSREQVYLNKIICFEQKFIFNNFTALDLPFPFDDLTFYSVLYWPGT